MKIYQRNYILGLSIFLFGILGIVVSVPKNNLEEKPTSSTKTVNDTIPKTIKLFFVGDLMGHLPLINASKSGEKYHFEPFFKYIKNQVSSYDLAVVNLEVTLAGTPFSGYPTFSSPDSYAFDVKNVGFDFFITANNHSADKGKKGIERTIDVLDSLKIMHTGTFKNKGERDKDYPFYWDYSGVRIAFLNYTYSTNGISVPSPNIVNLIDTIQINKDILKAQKDGSQFIIATMHWGEEYQRKQSFSQDKLAQWLADKGVDAIIGMHPHVVQPMKIIHPKKDPNKSVPVAFSLGNFISNQRKRYQDGGIGVELNLEVSNKKVKWQNWGYYPFWVQLGGAPKGYYVIPVSGWEKSPNDYNLTNEEKILIKQFANDTRELLKGNSEIKFD